MTQFFHVAYGIESLFTCHHHHHQSLNREGRWGTTDDFTTSFLHFSLFSTALWDLLNSRPVHSTDNQRSSLATRDDDKEEEEKDNDEKDSCHILTPRSLYCQCPKESTSYQVTDTPSPSPIFTSSPVVTGCLKL